MEQSAAAERDTEYNMHFNNAKVMAASKTTDKDSPGMS